MRVVVRVAESVDITSKGRVLLGEAHFAPASPEETQRQRTVEETVRRELQSVANTFVTAVDAVHQSSGWLVRAEVVDPRILAPDDVRSVEARSAKAIGESVDLTVRARADVLVTGTRYQAVGDVRLPEGGDGVPSPGTSK